MTEDNEKYLDLICLKKSSSPKLQILGEHEWYKYIIYYLLNLTCPDHLVSHKRRGIRLKATKYCVMKDGLRWRNIEGIVLRCVDEVESKKLISQFHSEFCGCHYIAATTVHKILRVGYYWSSFFLICISLLEVVKPINYSLGNKSLLPRHHKLWLWRHIFSIRAWTLLGSFMNILTMATHLF